MTYFKRFETEGSSEVGMCILRITIYHNSKVFYRLLVVLNHLISLRAFMNIPYVLGKQFYASTEREDGFFELLDATVCQSNQIINVCLECKEWFIFYC